MKLGRYEVVRELGKGAMGIVYLAKDPLIGRLVALKTIRPAAHSDDDETKEFQQRFVREAQAAGILNHPSIVTVHDIGQDEPSGMSFIAMEYVEGQNLKELLSQGRPLTFEQIGDIIAQVADGLDFAHAKGIVHRDVKPANIIMLEGLRAKITDFGIAKITSGGNLTTTGQFLGTPNYMAPEQIKGAPIDGRTDLFSLGICLYECLTHRKPFGGDSLTSISYKIVHEAFPPLHEINPQIPEGYEEVVAQCLAKEPGKRYQRGRDVAAALRAVIRGEKPVKPFDPLLAEATVITRDRSGDRLPTVEVPFPEASLPPEAVGSPLDTQPQPSGRISSVGTQPAPVAPKKVRVKVAPRELVRNTLTGVRTHPLWKRSISPLLFMIIVAAIAIPLVAAVVAIRQ
ncbi:MAG: serine/threonine-protein kinase, partial [Thermoanaerobaculia bacterium]